VRRHPPAVLVRGPIRPELADVPLLGLDVRPVVQADLAVAVLEVDPQGVADLPVARRVPAVPLARHLPVVVVVYPGDAPRSAGPGVGAAIWKNSSPPS